MPTPRHQSSSRLTTAHGASWLAIAGMLAATPVGAQTLMPPVVPSEIVESLLRDKVIVMQQMQPEGALEGALTVAYVIFDLRREHVYELLAQTERQIEFRPELTSIKRHRVSATGPVDEQRLKILFRDYAYHLQFEFEPERYHIQWSLDPNFDNDLDRVLGYWDLYALEGERTLGLSGACVDVGPGVPVFLQDWITRKNLPRSMARVRDWVNSGGLYRP